jgi:hypothetical protein
MDNNNFAQFIELENSSNLPLQTSLRMQNLSADASEILEFVKAHKAQGLFTNDSERKLAIVFHAYDLFRRYNPEISARKCMNLAQESSLSFDLNDR